MPHYSFSDRKYLRTSLPHKSFSDTTMGTICDESHVFSSDGMAIGETKELGLSRYEVSVVKSPK